MEAILDIPEKPGGELRAFLSQLAFGAKDWYVLSWKGRARTGSPRH